MKRATWKGIEREWAEALGGKRVPITGRGRGDVPDIEHPLWSIEIKAGRVLPTRLKVAMEQAEAAAVGTTKTPIVGIEHSRPQDPRGSLRYVMMKREDFVAWFGK